MLNVILEIKDYVNQWVGKWTIISGVVLFTYYKYATWKFDTFKTLGIKGPTPIIGLGTLGPVLRRGIVRCDLEMKQKYGNIFGVFISRDPFLMVFDTAILKKILIKDFHLFTNRMNMGFISSPMDKMLFLLKDDHWKHVRSIMTPTFSSGKMRKMADQINKCCLTFCNNLKVEADAKRIFDLRTICNAYTMDTIASTAFGVVIDSHNDPNNDFVKMASKLFNVQFTFSSFIFMFAPFLLKPLSYLGVTMFDESISSFFIKAIKQAIEQKDKNEKRLDFLQIMLNAHLENEDEDEEEVEIDHGDDNSNIKNKSANKILSTKKGLTEEELLAQGLVFFLVGFETTALTLSYFGYNMACNPDKQEILHNEIMEKLGDSEPTYDSIKQLTYLDMCFNETLRMFPPGPTSDRVASQDININGLFIPKGMFVGIPIFALQNDPDYWDEPRVFKPERFSPENWDPSTADPMRFIPFGAGPRNCVGMRLANMEIKMAAVHMIRKFQLLVSEETNIPPIFEKLTIKNKNGIKIRVEKR